MNPITPERDAAGRSRGGRAPRRAAWPRNSSARGRRTSWRRWSRASPRASAASASSGRRASTSCRAGAGRRSDEGGDGRAAPRRCAASAPDAGSRGRVVIGTVRGDLHDIGKRLVATLLAAHGFEVHDLGSDVPVEAFVAKARETGARIVGASALLTTTMTAQRDLVRAVEAAGLRRASARAGRRRAHFRGLGGGDRRRPRRERPARGRGGGGAAPMSATSGRARGRGPPLLLDGGLGSMLIARGLPAGQPPERWMLERAARRSPRCTAPTSRPAAT